MLGESLLTSHVRGFSSPIHVIFSLSWLDRRNSFGLPGTEGVRANPRWVFSHTCSAAPRTSILSFFCGAGIIIRREGESGLEWCLLFGSHRTLAPSLSEQLSDCLRAVALSAPDFDADRDLRLADIQLVVLL